MKIKEKIRELFEEEMIAWLLLALSVIMIGFIYLFVAGISFLIYRTTDNWFIVLGFLILGIAGFLISTILLGIVSKIFTGLVSKLCNLIDKKKIKRAIKFFFIITN